ncbi:MAG TPA: hypothetical protein VEX38_00805 [Fimbriimonadaceae bacterium]|nr:hypothetical protein [Fimbriimonadaceae bacterium]
MRPTGMKLLTICTLALAGCSAFAQTTGGIQTGQFKEPTVIRIPVFHADPYLIVALLEGRRVTQPELSSVFEFVGAPPAAGEALTNLFGRGKLIVNPTDNSILFFPEVGG